MPVARGTGQDTGRKSAGQPGRYINAGSKKPDKDKKAKEEQDKKVTDLLVHNYGEFSCIGYQETRSAQVCGHDGQELLNSGHN